MPTSPWIWMRSVCALWPGIRKNVLPAAANWRMIYSTGWQIGPFARHATPWERIRRWVRSNRRVALLSVCVAILLLVVAVVASTGLIATSGALDRERLALDQAQQDAYLNAVALAQHQHQAGDIAGAEANLARCPPRLRGWEWGYLSRLCHLEQQTLVYRVHAHDRPVFDMTFLTDSHKLATCSTKGTIKFWDAAGKQSWITVIKEKQPLCAAVSPDGQYAAFGGKDRVVKPWKLSHPPTPENLT